MKLSLIGIVLGTLTTIACASTSSNTGANEDHWDTESPNDEAKSTHLWVVDRGMDILSRHVAEIPGAANTLAWMQDAQCKENWHRGLLEADFLAPFNAAATDLPVPTGANQTNIEAAQANFLVVASHASWMSHFYNPSSGENYEGFKTSSDLSDDVIADPAYAQIRSQVEVNGPVPVQAKGAALLRINHATKLLGGTDVRADHPQMPTDPKARGCYELGLALHYFTDITQPMHAANFAATDRPRLLHSDWESYAEVVQSKFVRGDWTAGPNGANTADLVQSAAVASKAHFKNNDGSPGPLFAAIRNAYAESSTFDADGTAHFDATCFPAMRELSVFDTISIDMPSCWTNNKDVFTETGNALGDAQEWTARFLGTLSLPPH